MSNISDITVSRSEEAVMPFEEKMTWVSVVVTILVPVWYLVTVLGRLQDTTAAEIAWQRLMLIAFGATVALTIVGAILMSIATSVSAVARGRKPADDIDRKDERDKTIGRRGDVIGYWVASAGMVAVLILTMLEYEYFWIGSALYLSFVVAMVVSSVVKLVAYHRGF
jgi:hypothetical protein